MPGGRLLESGGGSPTTRPLSTILGRSSAPTKMLSDSPRARRWKFRARRPRGPAQAPDRHVPGRAALRRSLSRLEGGEAALRGGTVVPMAPSHREGGGWACNSSGGRTCHSSFPPCLRTAPLIVTTFDDEPHLSANSCTGRDLASPRPILSDANPDLQRLRVDRAFEPTCEDRGLHSERQSCTGLSNNDALELLGKGGVGVTECLVHFVDDPFEHPGKAPPNVSPASRLLPFLCDDRELLGDGLQPHKLLYASPGERHLSSLAGRPRGAAPPARLGLRSSSATTRPFRRGSRAPSREREAPLGSGASVSLDGSYGATTPEP